MGEAANEIPFLDFSKVSMKLEQGSEEWKDMSTKVREACESHGCFLLAYDKITTKLCEEMLVAIKSLFDLPEETKMKYISPKQLYNSYSSDTSNCMVPRRQSFGINEAQFFDAAQAFTNLMWPEGNPNFRDVFNSMSSKMLELYSMILGMIFESFGMGGKHSDLDVENHDSVLRVLKYEVPPSGDLNIRLEAHTDKTTMTILGHDEVQGLEILSKEGNWISLIVPEGCFILIVGDVLKVWTNGRLHAVKHRVSTSEKKERYSYGWFTHPKDGVSVEVPQELVDDEHPLLYRSFIFTDYLSYAIANRSEDSLQIYAGEVANEIPFLDFSKLSMKLEQTSEEWKAMGTKVREACESHGCFLLACDKITTKLCEEMLVAIKSLFDLPEETKMKYISHKQLYNTYSSGTSNCLVPWRQSFGIDDAQFFDPAQALTSLMWPEGNPNFRNIFNSMSSKMLELSSMILEMIFESFGMGGKHSDLDVENLDSMLQVMKYEVPPSGDLNLRLGEHTDKTTLTILGHDEVQGLEILSKEGNWISLMIPEGCFILIIGDVLKVWSNGRLHAVKHRVLTSEKKERYSYGWFTLPKDEVSIEVPQELVDDEHPLLYRSFIFEDYLSYSIANRRSEEDPLQIYAGV